MRRLQIWVGGLALLALTAVVAAAPQGQSAPTGLIVTKGQDVAQGRNVSITKESIRPFADKESILLVNRIEDIAPTRKLLREEHIKNVLVVLNTNKKEDSTDAGLQTLWTPITRMNFYVNLPQSTAEFKVMYGEDPTDFQKQQMTSLAKAVGELEAASCADLLTASDSKRSKTSRLRSESSTAREVFLADIAESSSAHALIVAHFADGNLKFHDGSTLPVSELKAERRWLITCSNLDCLNSNTNLSVHTGRQLAATSALRIAKKIREDGVDSGKPPFSALVKQQSDNSPVIAVVGTLVVIVATKPDKEYA